MVKNLIWLYKYVLEYLGSFFVIEGDLSRLVITVDVETAVDFCNWQPEAVALKHAEISRSAITEMIALTRQYNVPITWFCTGKTILKNEQEPLNYFGDLIDGLTDSGVGHEIASHTFSHPHCSKISRQDFIQEMQKLKEAFVQRGLAFSSHAYPWNEVAYLEELPKFSVQTVRIKEGLFPSVISQPEKSIVNLVKQSLEGTPLSFWLIKFGLHIARRKKACFVWLLHPENFYYQQDKEIIKKVFDYAVYLRKKGELKIITVKEI
jgi:peptidoglycan/xylan/chitin deacetylase (PgdA/CDA1 family)